MQPHHLIWAKRHHYVARHRRVKENLHMPGEASPNPLKDLAVLKEWPFRSGWWKDFGLLYAFCRDDYDSDTECIHKNHNLNTFLKCVKDL